MSVKNYLDFGIRAGALDYRTVSSAGRDARLYGRQGARRYKVGFAFDAANAVSGAQIFFRLAR